MHDFYGLEPRHMGSYDYERVKVLDGGFVPRLAREVVDPEGQQCLGDPYKYIVRSEAELVQAGERDVPVRPYWDPMLAGSATERRRLLLRLHELGLVGSGPRQRVSLASSS